MSLTAKATWLSTTSGSFTSGSNKWTGQEVEDAFINLGDSVEWTDDIYTISYAASFVYDCSNGRFQKITLTGNASFTVSNPISGREYRLLVIQDGSGGRTLSLPGSQFTNGGSIGGGISQRSFVSFIYDGTNYHFSIMQLSGT